MRVARPNGGALRLVLARGRRPQRARIRLRREEAVAEVETKQPELPELIREILADVGDDAVRTDDHLLRCSGRRPRSSRRLAPSAFLDPHHPAAGELALGLQEHRALRLERLEQVRPELQPQDVALVGEQVVADVQPRHRLEMGAHDAVDDQRADRRGVVAAVLEIVEDRGADGEPRLIAVVPLGDLRIEVPAVVVEARRVGDRPDLVDRLVLEFAEADDHVGDLNAGVVDVVLRFDRRPLEAERADQRIAERGVAQVADVRRLVRVDGGVLDDRLVTGGVRRRDLAARAGDEEGRPIQIQVQIAVGRGGDPGDARNRTERLRPAPARWPSAPCAASAPAGTPPRRRDPPWRGLAASRWRTRARRRCRTASGSRRRWRGEPVVERSESCTGRVRAGAKAR